MTASLLMLAGALIIGGLGTAHLVVTFYGPKLLPRDETLRPHMEQTLLVLTRETTVWKAWIGFNASHSLGAMLFALVYGYLALMQPALLFGSNYLLGLGLAFLGAFWVLGKRYWFSVPYTGIRIATLCYTASVFLSR